jgi:hypothetical protein
MNKNRIEAINAALKYLTAKNALHKSDTLILGRNVIIWKNFNLK